jgi:glycosyltransferase involved in cell wall biosynthesis
MPLFTIGIPTYNRAGFLRRSIEAALDQTLPDVEVLVSDDASTDGTAEVVRSFGDRVRYHRNPQNIGSWPNFAKLTELASGDFFSWLQDDDVVHCDFARRATNALAGADDIAVYAAFDVDGPSATVFDRPTLYGPPIALNWMRSELRVIDGSIVAPLSFLVSFVNPPAVAFRTNVIHKAVKYFDPHCALFNERIVVARAADKARVAVDPWPAAIFFGHEQQDSRLLQAIPGMFIKQWILLTEHIGTFLAGSETEVWKPLLKQCFDDMAIRDRVNWIYNTTPSAESWERAHPLARQVRTMLIDSLPVPLQQEIFSAIAPASPPSRFKQAVRQLMPPLAWGALRSIRQSLRHQTNQ